MIRFDESQLFQKLVSSISILHNTNFKTTIYSHLIIETMRYLEQFETAAPTDLELMTVVNLYDDEPEEDEAPDDLDDDDYGLGDDFDEDREGIDVDGDSDEDYDLGEEGEEDNYNFEEGEADEEDLY